VSGAARGARVALRADLRGRLVRRYKRFFADVETSDGRTLTVHCPNPGSMRGCAETGSEVRCSTSDDPKRRLAHTLEMIRVGGAWVGLHTMRANALVGAALSAGAIPELAGYTSWRREVAPGTSAEGTRFDFLLSGHARDPRPAWLEVKSATLAEGRLALFPDSVTARGRRHLEALAKLRGEGARAFLLFVIQRADCDAVAPADALDPAYGRALRAAAADGVELLAVRARVSPRSIDLLGPAPVLL
jgi:sugar fermentation stimulation protein A